MKRDERSPSVKAREMARALVRQKQIERARQMRITVQSGGGYPYCALPSDFFERRLKITGPRPSAGIVIERW